MKLSLYFLLLFLLGKVYSQAKDTLPCLCSYQANLTYPKEAEKNKISGEVIIEIKINDDCTWSGAEIIQKLGYGCDEEAMKYAGQLINSRNKCISKCTTRNCKSGKIKLPVKFAYTEE